jgi:hypothetical protein
VDVTPKPKPHHRLISSYAVATIALLLAGCSSAKVQPQVDNAMYRRLVPPSIVRVRAFDTSVGTWEGPVTAQSARDKLRANLAERLVECLGEIAATEVYPSLQPPADGWLITGKFVRVTAPRTVSLGVMGEMGWGGTKLVTEVTVYDLTESATDPIFVFTTSDGSKRPVGLVHEDRNDVDRTAREICDYLLQKLMGG